MELWGGLECTVNRIGDGFRDQLADVCPDQHLEHVDRVISLGLKAIRYPVLWEKVAPADPAACNWSAYDAPLARLRAAGTRVIAGLVHHGSGPAHTSLIDDEGFALGLAQHAARTAERYPWIEAWTPVNEPVTTARFSCLYGHWYPHLREDRAFWQALLNQIDATRLAMRAIRRVTPQAQLIQTDDLGRTFATADVRGQAAFNNLRRWAGWDLLCGRVTRLHPLFDYLRPYGFEDRLLAIADDPCPPDVIGLNHYLTSDRFLDHRVGRYPGHLAGRASGNDYVDTEAVRVLDPAPPGLAGVIREAWDRYGIPVAVTEVHNGCTREEQLRWLAEAWDTAVRLRADGVDIRAITAWALLGSRGWDTLLTADGGYEPGAFDVSGGLLRETALAGLLRALPAGGSRHPLASGAGWWARPIRFAHPVVHRPATAREHRTPAPSAGANCPPLLVCGAAGTLGEAFAGACALRNIPVLLADRRRLDLLDGGAIAATIEQARPWGVVNATGWEDVSRAERDPDGCLAINTRAAIALARAAAAAGIPSLSFSSDQVFDGCATEPCHEGSTRAPLNIVGMSKARMEDGIGGLGGRHLIVRSAGFFTPFTPHNPAAALVAAIEAGQRFMASDARTISPTYVPHLVRTALDLFIDGEVGIWHLTNGEALTPFAFARRLAERLGLPPDLIVRETTDEQDGPATPRNTALATRRGAPLPRLETALADYAAVPRPTAARARVA